MFKLDKKRLTFISGPCALESVEHSIFMAREIKSRCDDLDIQYIFKALLCLLQQDKHQRFNKAFRRGLACIQRLVGK